MKSPRSPNRRSILIGLARRGQVSDARAAGGRCLTASLELAFAAQRRGIAVSLVRWKVRLDTEYVDHWAVRLDSRNVLDLTRVQVDRSTRLVIDVDDYPSSYVDCRHYPASLFLADYAEVRMAGRVTLPAVFVLAMARTMFRFDVMHAVNASLPVRVIKLAADLGLAHVRVWRGSLVKRLEARRDGLARRLG